MRIDLTCPVELWHYDLPSEGYPACALMLYNLSDRLVSSVEVTLILKDATGDETERIVYRGHELDGRPGTAFRMAVPVNAKTRARSAEMIVEKIWYDDNGVWRRGKGPLSEYTPNALPRGRSLEMLRFVAGSNAVGFPQEQDGLWLCVCGRPNADYAHHCVRCHRARDQVFTRYNREAIEKLVTQREKQLEMQAKSAREDASRMQMEREQAYNRKKKRNRRIRAAVISVVAVAAAAYGTVFHLIPYLNYRSAVTAMENSDWGTAITAFEAMNDYLDAPDRLKACRYQEALVLLDKGDEESLVAARDTFLSLPGYEDADVNAQEAEYRRAGLLLTSGDTAGAAEIYTLLDGYRDSDEQLNVCAYIDATRLAEKRDWQAALDAFRALGDYKDSAAQADRAVYELALAAVEAGEPDVALAWLDGIPGYTGAEQLTKRAYYVKGAALREAGDNEAAGAAFLAAGDYEDAAELVIACIYDPAEVLFAQGDYAAAMDLYAQILGHKDATDKYMFCRCHLAETAVRDKEYALAAELLATLPDDYQNVAALKKECIYQPALDALKAKDWEAAAAGFAQVPGYKSADTNLKKARYGLAETYVKEGRLDEAIAIYEELGTYSQSVKKLRTARYTRAGQLMESGEYEAAAALYKELGTYSDSATRYKKAVLAHAGQLFDAGEYEAARAQYVSLGKYQGSDTRVMACDYQLALQLKEDGELLAAAELFASASGYQDAETQSQMIYYDLAEEAAASGQFVLAGRYYAMAGDYADARMQADNNYDAYYLEAYVTAKDAIDSGDYMLAVTLLGSMDLTNLPAKYAELADMYVEAMYLEGVRLYDAGRPYEAKPFFEKTRGFRNTDKYLGYNAYMIVGEWLSASGVRMTFREDGTCIIDGEDMCFLVSGQYTILTGETEEELRKTHSIVDIKPDTFTLRDDVSADKPVYRLTRMTADEAKKYDEAASATPTLAPTETPAPTAAPTAAPVADAEPTVSPTAEPSQQPAETPAVTPEKDEDSFLVEDE